MPYILKIYMFNLCILQIDLELSKISCNTSSIINKRVRIEKINRTLFDY
jgi:hypothetical protein